MKQEYGEKGKWEESACRFWSYGRLWKLSCTSFTFAVSQNLEDGQLQAKREGINSCTEPVLHPSQKCSRTLWSHTASPSSRTENVYTTRAGEQQEMHTGRPITNFCHRLPFRPVWMHPSYYTNSLSLPSQGTHHWSPSLFLQQAQSPRHLWSSLHQEQKYPQ